MKPITRSFKAFHREMQISRHPVFIFVEGKKIDPYFYGKIASSVCQSNGITYSLHKAVEFSKQGGGKQVLLSFFRYLKRKSSLVDNFKGQTTVSVFFLDKDIDDVLRIQLKSSHLIYTAHYDVYNHIYLEGNLTEAISAAASIDPNVVKDQFSDCEGLRRELACLWKDWIKLCIYAAKKKIKCMENYSVNSAINNTTDGSLNIRTHSSCINGMKKQLGFTDAKFNRSFKRISELVDEIYNNNCQDSIFKGKWYCVLLAVHIKRIFGTTADCNGLEDRITSAIEPTLNYDESWADHFKLPLENIIRRI